MRVILQRVTEAAVSVDGAVIAEIGRGYLALIGVGKNDQLENAERLAHKVSAIRLFPNSDEPERKPIDRPLIDVDGSVLAVSQFTLYADTSRGRRPSFIQAAADADARPIYAHFVDTLRNAGVDVKTGVFGADMRVSLINDGPVTIILED